LLQCFELSLRRVEASPELANEPVEVTDQALLEGELDLEVDQLFGELRWIGHRDLLSRGMRQRAVRRASTLGVSHAWLLGVVVVAGCEVPSQNEPSRKPIVESEPAPQPQAAGVDCHLIAQSITSLELGNYAEPEEREPRERAIETLCLGAKLTKSDADCLLASSSVADLAFCTKPLVTKHVVQPPIAPGDVCERYVRALERITRCSTMPPESAKALRQQIPQLRQMYVQYGSQQQVQDSCKMALDATEQAYQPLGC
jgi:hypothetical protein